MNEEFEARYDRIFAEWMRRCQIEVGAGRRPGGEGVVVKKNGTMAMTCRDMTTGRPMWQIVMLAGEDEIKAAALV